MASVRGFFFKIVWGGNTILSAEPLDFPLSHTTPRSGSDKAQAPSGTRDTWITGHDQTLSGDVRRIPGENQVTVYGHTATGWDGATGWAAFLEYARDGGVFTFFPNKDAGTNYTCTLIEPFDEEPTAERNGFRRLRLKIEDTSGTRIIGY